MHSSRHSFSLLVLLCTSGLPAEAQEPGTIPPVTRSVPRLVTLGSTADEWIRTEQLLGIRSTAGYLLRSPSRLAEPRDDRSPHRKLEILLPEVRLAGHSRLPSPGNDDLLWTGRGWNAMGTGGIRASYGRVALTLAPTLAYSENREYQIMPSARPGRDSLSSFWYSGPVSIDLPQRFGEASFLVRDWGQSSVTFAGRAVAFGMGTENNWWGPGIRNALVMSANAPGIPHLFARTSAPVRTRLGHFEGQWLLGALRESPHFDSIATNDHRSYAGAVLTFSPTVEPNLSVGIARAVYGPLATLTSLPSRVLDPFIRYNALPPRSSSGGGQDSARDQITSIFSRWVFPRSGFETYAEVARQELPRTARELWVHSTHAQGYTIGAQWAKPLADGVLRVQPEITYLEQSTTFTQRPVPTFYVSRMVPHGYTHRGRVIGAAIGPGASTQWLAVDYLSGAWQLGAFGRRVRSNNDAYYRSEPNLSYAHDVSLLGGLRGGQRVRGLEWELQLGVEKRYNYLFQNRSPGFEGEKAIDVVNRSVRVLLRPVVHPRRAR